MAKYQSEMFGMFFYSPKLTYEQLYEHEEVLLREVDLLLTEEGAEHLDFIPSGDCLRLQCEFVDFDKIQFNEIANKIKDLVPSHIEARLLCVDKAGMKNLYIFNISKSTVEQDEVFIKEPSF